jgi:hypothetical protein
MEFLSDAFEENGFSTQFCNFVRIPRLAVYSNTQLCPNSLYTRNEFMLRLVLNDPSYTADCWQEFMLLIIGQRMLVHTSLHQWLYRLCAVVSRSI